jgi:AcrR family transcriptional regulator
MISRPRGVVRGHVIVTVEALRGHLGDPWMLNSGRGGPPVSLAVRGLRRNYEQSVEQARLAFTESGVDASLDEIAWGAGVASGTLYRHFPTRLDLIEAALAEQIAELADLGRGLLAAVDEFDALSTWLRATVIAVRSLTSPESCDRWLPVRTRGSGGDLRRHR